VDYARNPVVTQDRSRIDTWVRHAAAVEVLREVLPVLAAADVPVLAVKGIVLARELHRDVAERPIRDVDLRVRPRDFLRAVRAMRARGLRVDYGSHQLGARSFRVAGELVEIESTIGPPGLCGLEVDAMLRRAVSHPLGRGVVVLAPEIVDHAVLLLVNAFKDKLVDCPAWSRDDLVAIARHPGFDASVFRARIRDTGSVTMAWIVADWLAHEHGSEAWRELRDSLGARPPRPVFAAALRRAVSRGGGGIGARLLARLGSDVRHRRWWALAATALGSAASWVGTRVDPAARRPPV
jgi:hypothetical protein